MTTDEQLQRLTGIVESLAGTVVAHDNQIEALLTIAEQHHRAMAELDARAIRHESIMERVELGLAEATDKLNALIDIVDGRHRSS